VFSNSQIQNRIRKLQELGKIGFLFGNKKVKVNLTSDISIIRMLGDGGLFLTIQVSSNINKNKGL